VGEGQLALLVFSNLLLEHRNSIVLRRAQLTLEPNLRLQDALHLSKVDKENFREGPRRAQRVTLSDFQFNFTRLAFVIIFRFRNRRKLNFCVFSVAFDGVEEVVFVFRSIFFDDGVQKMRVLLDWDNKRHATAKSIEVDFPIHSVGQHLRNLYVEVDLALNDVGEHLLFGQLHHPLHIFWLYFVLRILDVDENTRFLPLDLLVNINLDEAPQLAVHYLHEQVHEYLLDLVLVTLDIVRDILSKGHCQVYVSVLYITLSHFYHFFYGFFHVRIFIQGPELSFRNKLDLLEVPNSVLQFLIIKGAFITQELALVIDILVQPLQAHFAGGRVLFDLPHEYVCNLAHLSLSVGNLLVHNDRSDVSDDKELVGTAGDPYVDLVQSDVLG